VYLHKAGVTDLVMTCSHGQHVRCSKHVYTGDEANLYEVFLT